MLVFTSPFMENNFKDFTKDQSPQIQGTVEVQCLHYCECSIPNQRRRNSKDEILVSEKDTLIIGLFSENW